MRFLKFFTLGFLLSFSPASWAQITPSISRYLGRVFSEKEGHAACLAEAGKVSSLLASIKDVNILGSTCVERYLKSQQVVVDYEHPFGVRIEAFKASVYGKASCEKLLESAVASLNATQMMVLSGICRKSSGSTEILIDHVRTGKYILDQFEGSPSFATDADCQAFSQNIGDTFAQNGIFSVINYCYPVMVGTGREIRYSNSFLYSIELGKSIHRILGKKVAGPNSCQENEDAIRAAFAQAEIPVVAFYCEETGTGYRQVINYLGKIISRVGEYKSVPFGSYSECQTKREAALPIFTNAKRTILMSYCESAGDHYQFSVHYKEPKIEIPPKP